MRLYTSSLDIIPSTCQIPEPECEQNLYEEEDFAYIDSSLPGSSSPFSPLSRRGLNPIKPVYDPDQPDGWLNLTASAFNQLIIIIIIIEIL